MKCIPIRDNNDNSTPIYIYVRCRLTDENRFKWYICGVLLSSSASLAVWQEMKGEG